MNNKELKDGADMNVLTKIKQEFYNLRGHADQCLFELQELEHRTNSTCTCGLDDQWSLIETQLQTKQNEFERFKKEREQMNSHLNSLLAKWNNYEEYGGMEALSFIDDMERFKQKYLTPSIEKGEEK